VPGPLRVEVADAGGRRLSEHVVVLVPGGAHLDLGR
jgi:hypothetical protein